MFKRRTRRRPSAVRLFENLESRLLLAADTLSSPPDSSVLDEAGQYALGAQSQFLALTDAGDTRSTARDLGQLNLAQEHQGRVGGWDRRDVMRFSIEREAEVAIGLDQLAADLDLYLYDQDGRRVAQSTAARAASESIETRLAAGTYYVVVEPWQWTGSTYRLSLDADRVAPDPLPPAEEPPLETPLRLPEVAYFGGSSEWNLNAINAPEAWAAGYEGQGITVAVIDTGFDLDHPDLVQNLWVNPGEIGGNGIDDDQNGFIDDVHGWDFAGNDNRPDDRNGHGTHVAGTIAAANDGRGATGVATAAAVLPVRVLGDHGYGSALDIAAGIRYAADLGADVINLSLGGGFSFSIWSAIDYAGSLGSLVVAAAGNESAAMPGYPARFAASWEHVISVGAHDTADRLASFSNRVGSSGAVQVDAPGVRTLSTYVGGRYATLSGTSMAAPHVAGLAALALSANPGLSAADLRQLIVEGADRSVSGSDSLGGINAATTVAWAVQHPNLVGNNSSPSNSSNGQATAAASSRYRSRWWTTTQLSHSAYAGIDASNEDRPDLDQIAEDSWSSPPVAPATSSLPKEVAVPQVGSPPAAEQAMNLDEWFSFLDDSEADLLEDTIEAWFANPDR